MRLQITVSKFVFVFFYFVISANAQIIAPLPDNGISTTQLVFFDYPHPLNGKLSGSFSFVKKPLALSAQGLSTLRQNLLKQTINIAKLNETGAVSQRVNLVFLGDGYTQAEIPNYQNQAAGLMEHFFL